MRRVVFALALASALLVPSSLANPDAPTPLATLADDLAPLDGVATTIEGQVAVDAVLDAVPVALAVDVQADVQAGATGPEPVAREMDAPTRLDDARDTGATRFPALPEASPLARSLFVTFALAALALGADGWRVLHGRTGPFLGRLLRAGAAALALLPLFSRIERDRVLDNPARNRLLDLVGQQPGATLSVLQGKSGVAWGTAVHHLRRLEAHGLVVSAQQAGHHRYYLANSPASARRDAVALIAHPTARRIAELVAHRPGIDQTGICQALGLNNPAASKHLSQFALHGLVLSQRAGRSCHYHATGGLHEVLAMTDQPDLPLLVASAPARATEGVAG